MPDERYAFPAAGLDLHQRGMSIREFTAALVMAQLTATAYSAGNNATATDLAGEALDAADALCDALEVYEPPDDGG